MILASTKVHVVPLKNANKLTNKELQKRIQDVIQEVRLEYGIVACSLVPEYGTPHQRLLFILEEKSEKGY